MHMTWPADMLMALAVDTPFLLGFTSTESTLVLVTSKQEGAIMALQLT